MLQGHGAKVAVLGAAGGIGQPMGLLLKINPMIKHLALYDIVHTPGVAADLSHINTNAKVTAHNVSCFIYLFIYSYVNQKYMFV